MYCFFLQYFVLCCKNEKINNHVLAKRSDTNKQYFYIDFNPFSRQILSK